MAGILRFDDTQELQTAHWQKVIDVNLTGTMFLCRSVLPHLVETQGSIVNAASTAALSGLPSGLAYSASKGGVLAMTRSIAVEYAKRGVRANCICPGDINTGMTDNISFPETMDFDLMPRIMSLTGAKAPEVVAGVIVMLVSEDGVHITGEATGRGHQVSLVTINGKQWIADVGFGRDTPRAPVPLEINAPVELQNQMLRIIESKEFGFMLQKLEADIWKDLYSFDLGHVCQGDIQKDVAGDADFNPGIRIPPQRSIRQSSFYWAHLTAARVPF